MAQLFKSLVNVALGNDVFAYLTSLIAGVIFLGTPHRGTKAAKLGTIIAMTGMALGLGSDAGIIKELQEDSESSIDLPQKFTLWANRNLVPLFCFFEQYKTAYGKSLGRIWREMV